MLHADHDASGPAAEAWNASDYAHHLSRRARGLPLWFSLATHGTDAYRDAIETTLRVARDGAELVARRAAPRARHRAGAVDRAVPPARLGRARATRRGATVSWRPGRPFVTPSAWGDETVLRWCIVNPQTTVDDLAAIVASLDDDCAERPADLVVTGATCVATMDAERRELAGGWVAITDGLVSGVGTGAPPAGGRDARRHRLPRHARASSTPTTTCSRT